MSDRERWVIYPLLFLSLGLALRNHIMPAKQFLAERIWSGNLELAPQYEWKGEGSPPLLLNVAGGAAFHGDVQVEGTTFVKSLTAERIVLEDPSGQRFQLDVRSLKRATSSD